VGVRLRSGALEEALEFLFARTTGQFKFGLERTDRLLAALGQPHLAYPVIHVAGTNGKGSTLAMAEALLRARGLRVGKYTSPHLVDFRERILVNGTPINGTDVVDFVERRMPLVESTGASFFEATTAMAFEAFARARVDIALIETGLGGRLDSTNVVHPLAAGVTTIGWDHMEYLGHTLEAIAVEKAGIFKSRRPAVIGEPDAHIAGVLATRAVELNAEPLVVSRIATVEDVEVAADARGGTSATIEMFGERARLHTPLTGRHQATNLAFTLALLHAAGSSYAVSLRDANAALANTHLPGRFQRVGKYIFDVAHNEDGARVLAETLRVVQPGGPVCAVFCALRDKDWRQMLAALVPAVDSILLTDAPSAPASRAWSADDAGAYARQMGWNAEVATFDDALERAQRAATVVVTGSFHTVGDAMARLQVSPFEA
jgi:dihydrofolate synthase / folylpolyglutamate synthase